MTINITEVGSFPNSYSGSLTYCYKACVFAIVPRTVLTASVALWLALRLSLQKVAGSIPGELPLPEST